MEFLQEAIKALPTVAGSPLALIGYLATIAAWIWAITRNRRIKLVLEHIKDIPEGDRAETLRNEMGVVLPDNISAEEWICSKKHQYFLIAFIVLALTILTIIAIAAWKGSARLELNSVQQVLSIDGDELELSHGLTEESDRRYIFDITLRNPSLEPVTVTDIRIIFDPATGPAIASVEEISGTYVIRVSETGAVTDSPVGRFKSYAWYPSGSGQLYVKSPLSQTVEPLSVDRFRVIIDFPNNYQFRGDMNTALLQVMWNDERYARSKTINLASL